MHRKLKVRSIERMRLPKRFWGAKFDMICDGQHKEIIEKYLQNLGDAVVNGYGLVLWGANAVGKTSAASVILKRARGVQYSGLFVTAMDYVDAVFKNTGFDDASTVKSRCRSVDVLVLDDLGKEFKGKDDIGGVERMIEGLLRYRSSEMRPTIVTMNCDPGTLRERYGESLYNLMTASYGFLEIVGPSQRENEKKELKNFFHVEG
jgi:DNA replication protein DnaC